MAIHKLATGPITLTVTGVEQSEGNFGPQVRFDSVGDCVFISEMSAMRQLARLNLTMESVVGKTIHFEQIKKDGKTFVNMNLASGGDTPSAAPAPSYTPAPKQTIGELAAVYGECVAHAMATLGARCEEAGLPIDAAAIQSAAATLFIKATR
jgi:hypothetical protein